MIPSFGHSRTYHVASLPVGPVGRIQYNMYFDVLNRELHGNTDRGNLVPWFNHGIGERVLTFTAVVAVKGKAI